MSTVPSQQEGLGHPAEWPDFALRSVASAQTPSCCFTTHTCSTDLAPQSLTCLTTLQFLSHIGQSWDRQGNCPLILIITLYLHYMITYYACTHNSMHPNKHKSMQVVVCWADLAEGHPVPLDACFLQGGQKSAGLGECFFFSTVVLSEGRS